MNRISELRTKAGLSQTAFGKLFNAAQNTVSNWENGNREPSNEILLKMAEFFGESIDYILGRDEKIKEPVTNKDDGLSDMDKFLFKWLKSLTPEEIEAAQAYIQGRRDAQKD